MEAGDDGWRYLARYLHIFDFLVRYDYSSHVFVHLLLLEMQYKRGLQQDQSGILAADAAHHLHVQVYAVRNIDADFQSNLLF